MEEYVKKIKSMTFEIGLEFDKDREPFHNQQMVNKINRALKQQLSIMDEDGLFGKYQGYTVKIKTKLTDLQIKGE